MCVYIEHMWIIWGSARSVSDLHIWIKTFLGPYTSWSPYHTCGTIENVCFVCCASNSIRPLKTNILYIYIYGECVSLCRLRTPRHFRHCVSPDIWVFGWHRLITYIIYYLLVESIVHFWFYLFSVERSKYSHHERYGNTV